MGRTIIIAAIAVLVGLGAATGVTYGVMSSSAPDRTVNFQDAPAPNNSGGGASKQVDYGNP